MKIPQNKQEMKKIWDMFILSAHSWVHIECMLHHFIAWAKFSFLILLTTIFGLGF
jgi:hypothetical protein